MVSLGSNIRVKKSSRWDGIPVPPPVTTAIRPVQSKRFSLLMLSIVYIYRSLYNSPRDVFKFVED